LGKKVNNSKKSRTENVVSISSTSQPGKVENSVIMPQTGDMFDYLEKT